MIIDRETAHLAQPSRRDWLKGAASAVALAAVPAGTAFAAASRPAWIDAHAHIFSGEMTRVVGYDCFDPKNQPKLVQFTLDAMDKAGVEMSLFSVGTDSLFYDPDSTGKARRMNETFARIVSDHPKRFQFFASLPVPERTDDVLKEIDYALGTLKASGVHLYASSGKAWMGEPVYTPIFEELNRRKAVVKTHPVPNACCKMPDMPTAVVDLGGDTMKAISRMLFSGAAARYPDMKIIWSHAGGALLGQLERFIGEYEDDPKLKEKMPSGPEYELKRFYYDTAQSEHPATLAALKKLVPADHIMFGTDFPHRMPAACRAKVEESGVFTASELQGLGSGNVKRLLKLA